MRGTVKIFCALIGLSGASIIYLFASSFSSIFTNFDFGSLFLLMSLIIGFIFIFIAYQNIFKYSIESINSLTMLIGFCVYGLCNYEAMEYLRCSLHKEEPIYSLGCLILPIFIGWSCHRLLKAFLTHYTIEDKTQGRTGSPISTSEIP